MNLGRLEDELDHTENMARLYPPHGSVEGRQPDQDTEAAGKPTVGWREVVGLLGFAAVALAMWLARIWD